MRSPARFGDSRGSSHVAMKSSTRARRPTHSGTHPNRASRHAPQAPTRASPGTLCPFTTEISLLFLAPRFRATLPQPWKTSGPAIPARHAGHASQAPTGRFSCRQQRPADRQRVFRKPEPDQLRFHNRLFQALIDQAPADPVHSLQGGTGRAPQRRVPRRIVWRCHTPTRARVSPRACFAGPQFSGATPRPRRRSSSRRRFTETVLACASQADSTSGLHAVLLLSARCTSDAASNPSSPAS